MNSLLFLLLLGGLAAAGGGGSSSGGSVGALDPGDGDADPGLDPDAADEPPMVGVPNSPPQSADGGPVADGPDLPASAYNIGWQGLSAEEQLIVEMVNRARLDPQGELGRQSDGFAAGVTTAPKEALAVVQSLSDASDGHSQDMDNRDFFAHTNPDGESPSDRAVEAGHGSRFVGENIGWVGSTRTNFDAQARAEGHHDNLWDSDGHQQNFMSENWSEIGVGYDYGDYLGYQGSTFVTEMFGDRGETYLTGVVIEDGDGDDFYDIGEGQGGVRITAYNDDGAHATATWASGGYSLALPPGTYTVLFEGGDLDQPYETEVTIGNENVKLDVIDAGGSVAATLSAAPAMVADVPALLPEVPLPEDMVAGLESEAEEALLLF